MLDWWIQQFWANMVVFWTALWSPFPVQVFSLPFLAILTAAWWFLVDGSDKWIFWGVVLITVFVSPLLLLLLLAVHVFLGHYKNWFSWFGVTALMVWVAGIA